MSDSGEGVSDLISPTVLSCKERMKNVRSLFFQRTRTSTDSSEPERKALNVTDLQSRNLMN